MAEFQRSLGATRSKGWYSKAPRCNFQIFARFSHALPRKEFRKVVYLLRDGRDAMVSYRHYRSLIDGVEYDFLKFVSPRPNSILATGRRMSSLDGKSLWRKDADYQIRRSPHQAGRRA